MGKHSPGKKEICNQHPKKGHDFAFPRHEESGAETNPIDHREGECRAVKGRGELKGPAAPSTRCWVNNIKRNQLLCYKAANHHHEGRRGGQKKFPGKGKTATYGIS